MAPPLTGVVRPEAQVTPQQEAIALASGWILGVVGLIILIFIIFYKRKFRARKGKAAIKFKINMAEYDEIIRPYILKAVKKGYSEKEIKKILKSCLKAMITGL